MLILGQAGDVDAAVDDGVRDVDAAGAKLPGQRLRDGPRGELACGKVGELCAAPDGGRRTRDDQGWWVRGRVDRLEKQGEGALGEVEKAMAMRGIVSYCQTVLSCEGWRSHKGKMLAHALALRLLSSSSTLNSRNGLIPKPADTL